MERQQMKNSLTIRDYMSDGDLVQLDEIRREYDYLLRQKFELMDTRDTLLAGRRSIMDITRTIADITGRMRWLDERYHTISRLPQFTAYVPDANPAACEPCQPFMVDYVPPDPKAPYVAPIDTDEPIKRRGPYKKHTTISPEIQRLVDDVRINALKY